MHMYCLEYFHSLQTYFFTITKWTDFLSKTLVVHTIDASPSYVEINFLPL